MEQFKPLQAQSYEAIKEKVLANAFSPQEIYSETRLARELGISRTPVRDAVQRLAQEGYLDIIPSKGFRVHRMTEQDLLETYQIRCALEGFCAVQLAQEHDTPAGRQVIEALEALLADQRAVLEADGEAAAFATADRRFHQQIVYFPRNSAISSLFDAYQHRMESQATLSLRRAGRMAETLAEHGEILAAIRAGDAGRCYQAVLEHLKRPLDIIRL